MHIGIVASEAVPFAKTGGLADVAGALPDALKALGHDTCLFLPCYRQVRSADRALEPTGLELAIPIGPDVVRGTVLRTTLPGSGAAVYLVDQPGYFARAGLYGQHGSDYPDNCARFVFFSRAVLEIVRRLGLRLDVLHCNDWQSALIPVYLNEWYRGDSHLGRIGTLLTIHNLGYQGVFWHWDMPLTGLDWRLFHWRHLEFWGKLNFLKGGLVHADLLNTVSPTYAREIQTPEFGCGLDGLLRGRAADLHGIVNGIDTRIWNPATDSLIAANYTPGDPWAGKAACKAFLQRRAGLPERPEVPLFAQIGRLDPQKGWDLIARLETDQGEDHLEGVADQLLSGDVQMVVLGTGHPRYHDVLDRLAVRHEGKLRTFLEFSDTLAHQIEAGADLFLMPSLYEPCGLNQLYSLAYGTIPIVRRTGGLADTVVDATPEALADGSATGFAFRESVPAEAPEAQRLAARREALHGAIRRALEVWAEPPRWRKLVLSALGRDWSWERSARSYVQLYEQVLRRRSEPPRA